MSYTWEPKWEKIKIEDHGIELYTCIDRITNLIACPICLNARKVCIEGSSPGKFAGTSGSFFFSPEDLINHIRAFHVRGWMKRIEKLASSSGGEEE